MDSLNFLFYSYDALSGDLAWQVKKEGHNVKMYIKNPDYKDNADGFIDKTEDWEKEVDWANVIVFDDVLGHGKLAQKLREKGKLVVGGTPNTDLLEDSREYGQEQLKNVGVSIIPQKNFTSFEEAIEFVKQNPNKYVIKPSGAAGNTKRLLFIGQEEDGKDVLDVLEHYRRVWSNKIKDFQLQKKISGVEVAVGAFFNGKDFITPINVNFEHKKLFPGEVGPAVGEMGTTMFWSEPNKLFNSTLAKMKDFLAQEKYVGYADVNCIVNSQGIYPLEFTTRFGYPTISIQQEGMVSPIGNFLYELAQGIEPKLKVKKGFQIGVRVVVPPFPFDDKKTFENESKESVIIFKKDGVEGIHIEDVKMKNNEWVVAGNSGVILIACGCATSMEQARIQAYNRVNNILIPNMYYRTDIGERWREDSDKLHTWEYLRP